MLNEWEFPGENYAFWSYWKITPLSSPLALCSCSEASQYTFTQIFPIQKSKNSQQEESSKKGGKSKQGKVNGGDML